MNLDATRPSRPFGISLLSEAWQRDEVRALGARWPAGGRGIRDFRLLADALRGIRADGEAPAAGALLCAALLTDALHGVWLSYVREQEPTTLDRVLARAAQRLGSGPLAHALERFHERYAAPTAERPPVSGPARGLLAGELVLRWLAEQNPALRPVLQDSGDVGGLDAELVGVASLLLDLLEEEPALALTGLSLPMSLRAPAQACPAGLEAQLAWVREHWATLLPETLLGRFGLAVDLSREERFQRGGPPGPPPVLSFDAPAEEAPTPAAYSHDADWMPNVVLMAKSAYVWLYQLSRVYGRPITTLDRIPDEELDKLARWGVNGLWLIGLWQRSEASRRIKRIMGNPEAAASAYALFDYVIVPELGGEAAFQDLRARAWRRGIRLAGDMVPNHVGLDASWVLEHPERFVQADEPPYPCYRFDGPDLSDDPRVGLFLEDGYWTRSDAAVVFKHLDRPGGRIRYIYHGNDGTSMPWNDTAQLDYLRADVREAVIQTILAVAHRFPIIRFDAAMTLAKKHFQRLWYPKPGDEGAVPSRVERGLSKAEFDAAFPVEFWREVVDRVAAEAPDTLLLAEAFWLMEGYFVRTLGMHRVYNSAFMNMLKMEENAKYRESLRNVLAYDPGILQRFVNFMNNPDEKSAVEQFGRGDKYFGVLMMMVTMPGLPMLGHGQIEGFAEKYGMEYTRSYQDEAVDEGMVARHERQLVPLVRRRRLFSGVARFALYDLVGDDGAVNEDVFAWSNRSGDERALLLYHNAFREAVGRVRAAVPVNEGSAEEPRLVERDLCDALGVSRAADRVALLKDTLSGQWRMVPCDRLATDGLRVRLGAYQALAFAEIREVEDSDGAWRRLAEAQGDGMVSDPETAVQDLRAAPLHAALGALLGVWARWWPQDPDEATPGEAAAAATTLTDALAALGAHPADPALPARLKAAVRALAGCEPPVVPTDGRARFLGQALALPMLAALGAPPPHLRLEAGLARALQSLGGSLWEAERDARLALLLAEHARSPAAARWPGAEGLSRALSAWLGVNVWEGVAWLDRERLDSLLFWWSLGARIMGADPASTGAEAEAVAARAEAGGYRVEALR